MELDTSLTHQPSWIQVANRLFWEWLRFAVPLVPMVVAVAWLAGTALAQQVMPPQSALRPVVTRAASRSGRHRAVRQGAASVPPPRPRPSADR